MVTHKYVRRVYTRAIAESNGSVDSALYMSIVDNRLLHKVPNTTEAAVTKNTTCSDKFAREKVLSRLSTPQKWWGTDNATGLVHPDELAPDPLQPRRHIDPDALAGLTASIASVGVRDPIVVTPVSKAPWRKMNGVEAFFLIVSGHRRHMGAIDAEISEVPIRVRLFKNKEEHETEASILNKQREDLTSLEEGYEILLMRKDKWTLARIAATLGKSVPWVIGRLNLTKLDPGIQKLLDPRLKAKRRLPITVAAELGGIGEPTIEDLCKILDDESPDSVEEMGGDERRFCLQRFFLNEIQSKGMSAKRAVDFIQGRIVEIPSFSRGGAEGKKSERQQPKRRMRILESLVETLSGSQVIDWTPADFNRIFENCGEFELQEIIARAKEGKGYLDMIINRLEKVQTEKKRVGSFVDKEMVLVRYYADDGEFVQGRVTYARYVALWFSKQLEFVREGSRKPKHYPSLEEARKKAGL